MTIPLRYAFQERFTRLTTQAARQADVMVPVIAGPTILRDKSSTEHKIQPEWGTKISSVIIKKQDLTKNPDRLELHLPVVVKVCGAPKRNDSALPCDTRQRMAVMQLQLRLDEIDRKYMDNPIPPGATAKTDLRLRQEITGILAELMKEGSALYCVGLPKRQ